MTTPQWLIDKAHRLIEDATISGGDLELATVNQLDLALSIGAMLANLLEELEAIGGAYKLMAERYSMTAEDAARFLNGASAIADASASLEKNLRDAT